MPTCTMRRVVYPSLPREKTSSPMTPEARESYLTVREELASQVLSFFVCVLLLLLFLVF